MKKITIAFVLTLLTHLLSAQDYFKNEESLKDNSEQIMELLEKEKFIEAFSMLKEHWPLPENEIEQLESTTIKQFNLVADRFGKIIGHEFIKDERIKNFLLRRYYVLRFEKHAIRVLFTYYKNRNGWMLNSFKWDDQMDELFE